MKSPSSISLFALLVLVHVPALVAEDWPCWRGPRGDGSSLETELPLSWDLDTGTNVRWRVPVPGEGHSSPIVWKNRVYLTTCLTQSKERVLLCLDRTTGKEKWRQTVFAGELETVHALNSRASGTPATDGKLIYVALLRTDGEKIPAPNVGTPRDITSGEIVVAAYDLDGNRRWLVSPGEFISAHGFCSCPVLFEDLVIINGDHDGHSYVVALEQATGKERWRVPRKFGIRSYVTPIIREIQGRPQMVFSGSKRIVSLSPSSGERIWTVEGPTEQFVASMVFDGQQFYMNCGYPDHYVVAVDPTGTGDVTKTHVRWQTRKARAYVPSPVVVDGYLVVADDRGTANCFDTDSGRRLWQTRVGGGFRASLLQANKLVYFFGQAGEVSVLRPGPQPDFVAKSELGEAIFASAAASQGCLFIRAERSLFCIEDTLADKSGDGS